ncbi:MAG: ABC transporter substrate-binding protein, partial [Candidatus Dojkabacteria bacterium]|nr:ABC transporter substrate-binding protein [Candidatus Dojkabacteria bacterium]
MYKKGIFAKIIFSLFKPILLVEKFFYLVRDFVWDYPKIFEKESILIRFLTFCYKTSLPVSNFILSFFIFTVISILIHTGVFSRVANITYGGNTLIEGVVMGVDSFGFAQKLTKVDPFAPTNVQLEKDLVELIYEPLIKFEFTKKGDNNWKESIRKILVLNVIEIRAGADYRFDLKENIYWHDGKKLTADDVIHTFDIVSKIDKTSNSYILAIKQLQWEKITDYSIRVCTKNPNNLQSCANTKDNPILSNFLELISIKIVPKHLTFDLNPNTYDVDIHPILLSPVGTGKFKFESVSNVGITLVKNNAYHIPEKNEHKIDRIFFKYFKTLEEAKEALIAGNIHTLGSFTTEFLDEILSYKHIGVNYSEVLLNQYWAIYFNLKKDQAGKLISKQFFDNVNVRRAISHAINREEIIKEAIANMGEEAFGPINKYSEYFNPNAPWARYDLNLAIQLLEKEGWTKKYGEKYLTNKNGEKLEFRIVFFDNFDRRKIVFLLKKQLEEVGINLVTDVDEKGLPKGLSLDEISNQIIRQKKFDTLLFGVNTFIDPDRYELFHTSQSDYPGLNLSSYESTAKSVIPNPNRQSINDRSVITVPKVDKLLDQARRFDPKDAIDKRKQDYFDIQELIALDAPVIFLYHPRFIYYA